MGEGVLRGSLEGNPAKACLRDQGWVRTLQQVTRGYKRGSVSKIPR